MTMSHSSYNGEIKGGMSPALRPIAQFLDLQIN